MTSPVPERLSPANLAWLKEFSVVMHRRFAYPPRHPSRVAAEGIALRALSGALERQPEIFIAITKRQIAIGGAYSDPKNPALGELAERLHRQGVGTITLRTGITPDEFEVFLDRIVTARPRGGDEDIDDDDADNVDAVDDGPVKPLGDHVAIDMLSYEGLALSDETADDGRGPDATGDRLWRELAEATLAGWDGFDGFGEGGGGSGRSPTPMSTARISGAIAVQGQPAEGQSSEASPDEPNAEPAPRPSVALRRTMELPALLNADNVAKAISAQAHDARYAGTILQSLLKVGRHSRKRGRSGSGAVASRLRDVLGKLEPGALQTLLESEVDPARRQLLLSQGVDALPVSAVIDWVEAAANSSGESISQHLLRLLHKLSAQTKRRRDNGPDEGGESLRQAAHQLIEGWSFSPSDSEAHSMLLERIAKYDSGASSEEGDGTPGPDRVVQIALESNVCGPDVIAAVDELIDAKRLGPLFGYLDQVVGATVAAPMIGEHLLEAETVRRVLLGEPLDREGATILLERCESPQAEGLLDALAISESESTRHLMLGRLRELGDSIRQQMVARLDGAPWYVQRNLLSLIGALPIPPDDLPLESFMTHEEPRLRAEALALLARLPDRRDAAIHAALADPDQRVVHAALAAAADGLPRRSAPRVMQLIEKTDRGSELRLRALPLLAQVPLPTARDWLLSLVSRRRLFRGIGLTAKSPEMLGALRVLALRWPNDAAAAAVLKLAAKSSDRQIADAIAAKENG